MPQPASEEIFWEVQKPLGNFGQCCPAPSAREGAGAQLLECQIHTGLTPGMQNLWLDFPGWQFSPLQWLSLCVSPAGGGCSGSHSIMFTLPGARREGRGCSQGCAGAQVTWLALPLCLKPPAKGIFGSLAVPGWLGRSTDCLCDKQALNHFKAEAGIAGEDCRQ